MSVKDFIAEDVINMNEVSDGRLYTSGDLVKADVAFALLASVVCACGAYCLR